MSYNDEDGWGGIIIGLLIIAAVILIIVCVIIPLFLFSMGLGAFWGSGKAIYNYAMAFKENVNAKPLKV